MYRERVEQKKVETKDKHFIISWINKTIRRWNVKKATEKKEYYYFHTFILQKRGWKILFFNTCINISSFLQDGTAEKYIFLCCTQNDIQKKEKQASPALKIPERQKTNIKKTKYKNYSFLEHSLLLCTFVTIFFLLLKATQIPPIKHGNWFAATWKYLSFSLVWWSMGFGTGLGIVGLFLKALRNQKKGSKTISNGNNL